MLQPIPPCRPILDPAHPYKAIVSGWYDYGPFQLFVPEGSHLVQPTVFIAGLSPADLGPLGWQEVMEQVKANYVVMPYLTEAYFLSVKQTLKERRTINPYSSAFYLIAYGNAAREGSLLCARHPEIFAGAALLGPTAELGRLEAIGRKKAPEEDHRLDVVPLPLWVVEEAEGALAYWKRVNGCMEQKGDRFQTSRRPDEDRDRGADIVVGDGNLGKILDFLFEKRRFPGLRDGNLRNTDLPEQVHAVRQEAMIDGFARYWYTYVPKRKLEERLPLVLVLHGRGGEGGEFIARSGWHRVSDEVGCITVYPTGASGPEEPITYWNFYDQKKTPLFADDISFLSQLTDRLCKELPVDPSRVYVSGQSMGSMMSMTMAMRFPERFAASASSAGLLPGFMAKLHKIEARKGAPMWVSLGEYDSFVRSNDPKDNEAVSWFLETLGGLYGVTDSDLATRGLDVDYVLKDSQGEERLRYTRVKGKTHAILPSEARLFWQWMRAFQLDR